ncbi:VanW family protein [Phycicoccus sp. SLBN-51]|uniref:VanW family protein n=1 Tax=Phycicoccus sp. SLBN-51 TaxID=2768447 RepID=UPI0011708C80|nr:VanW family protein [Phycicoccus sp. SLBN-51]TQJ49686.1 vancomycin resistance protein YoaR [Phycicoccus sp. SLBN-51]
MVRRGERGGAALRLVIALAVLAAAYIGLAAFLGRHVPANASVAGIPIGGKSPADAEATLKRQLASQASAPVRLSVAGRTVDVDPSAAGLSLDLDETLQGLSGFSLKPADVWNHLNGGDDEPLRTDVDRDRLRAVLAETAKGVDKGAQEGAIAFPGGAVKVVNPVTGMSLDVEKTADVVAAAWPTTTPVKAVVNTVPPKTSADEVQRARTEFADKAMAGPVRVSVGSTTVALEPAEFAPAVTMRAGDDGSLTPAYDSKKLLAAVRAAAAEKGLEPKAEDASFRLQGGKAVLVPAKTGLQIDEKSLVDGFGPALTSSSRTVKPKTTVVQPDLTTEKARKIAPREVISTFTTQFPFNPPRTENITLAARTLNGTFVAPGKTFSLNGLLGQRTGGKGYNEAPVIVNGRLTKDFGGGISQLSTTLFNAIFFSGARIEEHHPHSFYIARYPEGREATISWPDVDNRFTNDTAGGILIEAYVSGNSVTVTFHGIKTWDIKADKGPRRNVVKPKKIVDDRPTCVPQSPTPGFDVTVTRIFTRAGKEVKRSTFDTHYIPEDDVTCTHPKAS